MAPARNARNVGSNVGHLEHAEDAKTLFLAVDIERERRPLSVEGVVEAIISVSIYNLDAYAAGG